jgi:hypothetical protein
MPPLIPGGKKHAGKNDVCGNARSEPAYKRATRLGGLSNEIGKANLPMGKIEKRPWGERSFFMKDPFGNPTCFVDEKALFRGQ